ncbi:MAG: XisI protein [Bacteroidota bacterium]
MDKLTIYQEAIKSIILKYSTGISVPEGYEEYESQAVIDDERGHYFVYGVGWNGYKRIHGCTIHIDLKGEKVWVQKDATDSIIVDQLMELGVLQEDIILAFHAPYKRPYTGFAIA